MEWNNRDNLSDDRAYRIRYLKSLVTQIKKDRADCDRLWEMLENRSLDMIEEELIRVISWLREDINMFREIKGKGIEGFYYGEIDEIEMDLKKRETNLIMIKNEKINNKS